MSRLRDEVAEAVAKEEQSRTEAVSLKQEREGLLMR